MNADPTNRKNYLLVFKEMEVGSYNEKSFKDKHSGKRFLNQLHVTKHYLKQQVLQSLRSYHKEVSQKAVVYDLLRNIEILYLRELYVLCNKEISKAESIATKYEMDVLLLEIFQWKRKVSQALAPFDSDNVATIIEMEGKAARRINETFNQKAENVEIYREFLKAPRSSNTELKVKPTESGASTLEAKVYQYHSKYYEYLSEHKYKESEQTLFDLLDLLEQQEHRLNDDPGLYFSTINNLLGYLVFSKQYEKSLELIEKAKRKYNELRLGTKRKVLLKQIVRTYNIELEVFRDLQRKGVEAVRVDEIEAFIEPQESNIQEAYRVLFWYQFASIYFMQGKFNDSLKWINKLLNYSSKYVRADLQIYSRILNLMIHYELNNLFVLGYYIDNAKRFLQKHQAYQGWKKELLRHFSLLRKSPSSDARAIFYGMKVALFDDNKEYPINQDVLDYIDLERWIEFRSK